MVRALLGLALALAFAAPASAQDAATAADLDRAAAYWNASPDCPNGVRVAYDQEAVTDANNAIAGGCGIWVGDKYQAETPAQRCQTIVHEWGHLLGWGEDHAWHEGLPADPAGVMASGALPPACAALDQPQPTATPQPPRVGWKTSRSLAIAQAVWHPACGQLRLGYGDPAREGAGDAAGGWAWAGDCLIRIPNGSHYGFEELCTIVLHESGHVAGMGHSSNPQSVMYAEPLVIKTTARISGRTITRWNGVDRRCLHHGRPFLERHGLL